LQAQGVASTPLAGGQHPVHGREAARAGLGHGRLGGGQRKGLAFGQWAGQRGVLLGVVEEQGVAQEASHAVGFADGPEKTGVGASLRASAAWARGGTPAAAVPRPSPTHATSRKQCFMD